MAALLPGVAPARAQTPPAQAAAAAQPVPREYRLGAGDVVRISVFQNPDLALDGRISDTGLLSYPLLGQIHLGGLSVTQAEKLIGDGLREGKFVKQPQVTLVVMQVRGNQVSVLGQVNRPGRYPLETADLRLSDLIATAGGIAPTGSDIVVVTGVRAGKAFRYQVDLPTLFAPGGRDKDMLVQNDDSIWVDRQPLVYIYGEVQRPGAMRLEREMTLLQVLAAGGGLTLRGTDKGIAVHRRDPATGRIDIIRPAMTDKLQDGDVVYVRESLF
ncbi:MAG: polysaccharide export protein EpsE [Burkholderiales bacterium]|nr:polysaccharide export protein EpsE [Burkholderiales bacterium]